MAEKIFFVGESIQLFESADSKVGSSSHPENNVKDVLRDEEVRLYNQLVSTSLLYFNVLKSYDSWSFDFKIVTQ